MGSVLKVKMTAEIRGLTAFTTEACGLSCAAHLHIWHTTEATIDVHGATMIFIVVKFSVRPAVAEQWLVRVAPFTAATRAEPGNVFFEWSRSVERPNQFVLLEAFRDRAAGEAHVHSEHFQAAMAWMPDAISETPEIIHVEVPGDGWSTMAELQPRTAP